MTRRMPGARALVLTLALAAVVTGCAAGGDPGATGPTGPTDEAPVLEPVIDSDFPDPDILEVDGTYYAYATNTATLNVQVATSTDLETWERLDADAFPDQPSWVIPGKTWAPEVTELAPGSYALYFTATNFRPTFQCIGVATASDPAGPFVAQGEGMLVCPDQEGGAIDASTVVDASGVRHLVWKNDGNCCGYDTWIQSAPLTADGLALAGPPQRLLMQTEGWEGDLVEAPTILARDGGYVMLYSANSYGADQYAIGLATAPELAGPWTKEEGPWLSTELADGLIRGPGGQDVVTAPDGSEVLALHGWDAAFTYRGMYVVPLEWEDGVPRAVVG